MQSLQDTYNIYYTLSSWQDTQAIHTQYPQKKL
jgi:hypothetical protein